LGGIEHAMTNKSSIAFLVLLVGCGPGPKTADKICPGHQMEVWDAGMSYYLEHSLKPDDLIDPRQLTNFFAEGQVPVCPRSTNGYAPFRILYGPKCPYHAVRTIPARVAKLKERTS
jgi:hypothetical protein